MCPNDDSQLNAAAVTLILESNHPGLDISVKDHRYHDDTLPSWRLFRFFASHDLRWVSRFEWTHCRTPMQITQAHSASHFRWLFLHLTCDVIRCTSASIADWGDHAVRCGQHRPRPDVRLPRIQVGSRACNDT